MEMVHVCTHPTSPLLGGGGACAQINPDGTICRALFGCLPASMPQTSLAGEFASLACAYDNGDGNCYVGDCQAVLSSFNKGLHSSLFDNGPHACTWRMIAHRYPDWPDRISSVAKVKAHKCEPGPDCSDNDFRSYWGNFHADLLAKEGAALHSPPPEDIAKYKSARKDLICLAEHMVDTLSCLRLCRLQGAKFPRLPLSSGNVIRSVSRHQFKWQGNRWICTNCLFSTKSPSSVTSSQRACKRRYPLARILDADNGHHLWCASVAGGGNIVYCSRCWNYASSFPRNLLLPCVPPMRGIRPCARFYLRNQRHPISHSRFHKTSRVRVN